MDEESVATVIGGTMGAAALLLVAGLVIAVVVTLIRDYLKNKKATP